MKFGTVMHLSPQDTPANKISAPWIPSAHKIWEFHKSKLLAAATTTDWRILTKFSTMVHIAPRPCQPMKFENLQSKMAAVAILQKKKKNRYVCSRLTHSEEIWHSEASPISRCDQPIKF